jgi:hypothetical protein
VSHIYHTELALLEIQERNSVGSDEIPNWLLKTSAVCCIYNSSIREGYVPTLWKNADVLPLGKIPQPKFIESDLRPISLTPVLSKVLEGFILNWVGPIVMPYINPYQFGNVKNRYYRRRYYGRFGRKPSKNLLGRFELGC